MTLYDFAKGLIWIVGRTLWRLRAYGTENVPMTGPLVVACNHVSNLDPPLMGSCCPRRISYMAKKELFAIPVLGPAIAAVGAYPVDREGSARAAIKKSLEILTAGGCVGIFPEGGRNMHGDKEARTGAALLASLAHAPVVPVYIGGSGQAARLHQIKVAFGKPLWLPQDRKATREDLAKFTEDVMAAIGALRESIDGNSQS
ncbi:MAG TPA: lysophospholipid acyltransferase family protein [Candidatus Acidoferrales bacterium]|nr:lysophospholipid acyltransferase family protein [Candidatus Acidoferrales bacterium]